MGQQKSQSEKTTIKKKKHITTGKCIIAPSLGGVGGGGVHIRAHRPRSGLFRQRLGPGICCNPQRALIVMVILTELRPQETLSKS